MKKNVYRNTLLEMSRINRLMPRTISEAMDYPDIQDSLGDEVGEEMEVPQEGMTNESMPEQETISEVPQESAPTDAPQEDNTAEPMMNSANGGVQSVPGDMRKKVATFFDDIRKKSLLGMAELADYPNSMEYEQMKKLWQLCDKKPEPKQGQTL